MLQMNLFAGPELPNDKGPDVQLDQKHRPDLSLIALAVAPPNARDAAGLGEWLAEQLGKPVHLTLTANRSTMLSYREQGDGLHLRLHEFFAAATPKVLWALAALLASEDLEAVGVVDRFINDQCARLIVEPRPVQPQGRFHDLGEILDEVNTCFFHNECGVRITWGQAGSRRYRRSIQLGSYVSQEKLIRIHPCLDQAWVPRQYVAWIVFHETLHEVMGTRASATGNRRSLHPPEFSALEETFPNYRECKQWENDNLYRLLRFNPRAKPLTPPHPRQSE